MSANQTTELSNEEREQIDLFIESQLKLMSETFEKSTNYTNLLLVAGYAGFFALWQVTREFLSKGQVLWSALLMLISIVIFIVYEIFRSLYTTAYLHTYYRTISKPEVKASLTILNRTLETFQSERRNATLGVTILWAFVFGTTAVTGLAAASILLYAFIRALLKQ